MPDVVYPDSTRSAKACVTIVPPHISFEAGIVLHACIDNVNEPLVLTATWLREVA